MQRVFLPPAVLSLKNVVQTADIVSKNKCHCLRCRIEVRFFQIATGATVTAVPFMVFDKIKLLAVVELKVSVEQEFRDDPPVPVPLALR
jgi:hypothetical protein